MLFWILLGLFGFIVLVLGVVVSGDVLSGPEQMLAEAEEKLESGNSREAATLLQRVMESNPGNAQARWQMGKLMQGMGQYASAAEHFEACLNDIELPSGVERDEALKRLANVHETAGEVEKAIDDLSRYLEDNPQDKEIHLKRGKLFMQNQQYDRAIGDFQTIRREFEDVPEEVMLLLARAYEHDDEFLRSLDYFEEYLDDHPDELETSLEAARVAEQAEEYEKALNFYDVVRSEGPQDMRHRATVHLIRMFFERNQFNRMQDYLDELEQDANTGELSDTMYKEFQYWKGRHCLEAGREEKGINILRDLHEEDPDFRDLKSIMDEKLGQMEEEDLMREYANMHRDDFVETSRRIVEVMGYEPMNTDSINPEEVNIRAQEEAESLKVNRVLFGFKRWNNKVGEWPLKEFELEVLEQRYDRGFFVSARGFKPAAHDYVEHSDVELIGPDELLEYLREAQKQPQ